MNNNLIRRSLIFFLIFVSVASLAAMGRADDAEPQEVAGLENWNHEIDTSDLPPGEYNIIVRGTDRAGNVGAGGPYNIYIDPSIQIPTVSISNPIEGSRSGNLVHVVGTAVDDEAVKRVEIAVDEGNYQPANGAEFWSARLDSSGWDDGLHTLKARAWDEDGNESPAVDVSFYKDTGKPEIEMLSHKNGSYISGRIVFQGIITDMNEVAEASFSADGGRNFVPLKISQSKTDGQWVFLKNIDSRSVKDGAHVFWIEAVDGLGSRARQSFLYYVDNSPPELELLFPADDDPVNGSISLIGSAVDAVGVSSLRYEADNGTEGDIMLSPGNPVWVLPLDYNGFSGKEAKIEIFLADIVGNQISRKYKIPLDHDADLPDPGITGYRDDKLYTSVPVITGMIIDDDGSSGFIEYSLNKGEWQSLEVDGPWVVSLDDSIPGINKLEMRAVDSSGLAGPPVGKSFSMSVDVPEVVFDDYYLLEDANTWMPGRIIDAGSPGTITGRIFNAGEAKLFWSLNDGELKTLSLKAGAEQDEKTFFIKLPKNEKSGRMNIRVVGTDSAGMEFSSETVYYNYLAADVEEGSDVPPYTIPDSKGLYLLFPRSELSSYTMLDKGYISGWSVGGDIVSAALSAGEEFLKIETSANGFRIIAAAEGKAENVVLTLVLKNGDELSSKPMNIAVDRSAPKIEISGLSAGMLTGGDLEFTVATADNTGESSLFYSINGGGTFNKLVVEENSAAAISFMSLEDGFVDLIIKAEDSFRNAAYSYLPLLKDTTAPEIDFITSDFDGGAEQITYSGHVADSDRIESLRFEFLPQDLSGEVPVLYSAVLNGSIFSIDVNLTSLGFDPGSVVVTAADRAGNIRDIKLELNIDLDKGRPLVGIQVPEEMGASETGFNLSGLILDNEGIESIFYSINDGPFKNAGSGNLYTVTLGLEDLLDDHNTVSVKAVDVNGLESEPVIRNFLISLEEPEVRLDYPELDNIVRGVVVLRGSSSDVNGIREVSVSHDNGNTFQKAEGREDWSYSLDTRLLDNGVSSLLIKAEDAAGVTGYYPTIINVDNEAPSLRFSHPADGEKIRSVLSLSGHAVDNSSIDSLKITMKLLNALESDADIEPSSEESFWTISSRGTVLEDIDLKGFTPGFYSFRAEALDGAENLSTVSRVLEILPEAPIAPEILSPLPGEVVGPYFSIQGHLPDHFVKVILMVNNEVFKAVDVSADGSFRYDVVPEDGFPLGLGRLSIRVDTLGESLESESILLEYLKDGLWVSLDNISSGQYVADRFVIEGRTGYETVTADEKILKTLYPDSLSLSTDGGLTFKKVKIKDGRWKHTLYSEEIPDGPVDLLIQSSNGIDTAFVRSRVVMDSRGPEMLLFDPHENEHLYGNLFFSGEASDDGGLTRVLLSLREGGKDNYETPSFIQGMYFDASALGATYFTTGLGLSFMDDNVKLQLQYGYAPTMITDEETGRERSARFGGNVFGAKLLANLAQIPFSWLFGPELSFMSASAALGADFSYFSSNSENSEESWGVILAGVVGQLEIPKITFEDREFLRYVSVYWEGQLWLISSDVSPEVILLPSIGIRLGLF